MELFSIKDFLIIKLTEKEWLCCIKGKVRPQRVNTLAFPHWSFVDYSAELRVIVLYQGTTVPPKREYVVAYFI